MRSSNGVFLLLPFLCAALVGAQDEHADIREKVTKLRSKMSHLVDHAQDLALPADIVANAQRVDKDAEDALSSDSEWLLKGVISEASSFMADLQSRKRQLLGDVNNKNGADAAGWGEVLKKHPELMVKSLRAKAMHLIGKLEKEKGFDAEDGKEKEAVVAALREAAGVKGNSTDDEKDSKEETMSVEQQVAAAKTLEGALDKVRAYFLKREQRLTDEEAQLQKDVVKGQVMQLYYLLKKRKSLPLASQEALLKRPTWHNVSYAVTLLKELEADKAQHKKPTPLYKRLEELATKDHIPVEIKKNTTNKNGVMSVPGSEGRVFVVSSKLKNSVKDMAANLLKMKVPLQQFIKDNGKNPNDAANCKQAKEIMDGIDEVVSKVHGTHDFATQMGAMNAMGDKLAKWAAEAESREQKEPTESARKKGKEETQKKEAPIKKKFLF